MSNQSYKKCMYCDQEILMDQINGKWGAYNLNGGFHQCNQSAPTVGAPNGSKPIVMVNELQQQVTLEDRVARLENVLDAILATGAKK